MTFVTNDPEKVSRLTGFDSWYHSLPPKLGIDQWRTTLPLLVKSDESEVLVAKEIDRTNIEAARPPIRLAFHSPYFKFDRVGNKPADVYANVSEAVAKLAGSPETVELDPWLSVKLYGDLCDAIGAPDTAAKHPFTAPMNHYRVPRANSAASVRAARDAALSSMAPYAQDLGITSRIAPFLNAAVEDRFDVLDALMAARGLDALIASNPVNVQELSGLPAMLAQPGVFAIYSREGDEVHLLTTREIPWLGLPEPAPANSKTVAELIRGGALGYEELDMSRLAYEGFGLSSLSTRPASTVFRRWRELRSWEDLPYYILAAQITERAISSAVSLVQVAADRGQPVVELDAYRRYREVVASEIANRSLPVRVRTYFTHAHGGDRSGIPARATDHSLSPLTSLKIDAGLEVYDTTGALRAVSDITRSAVGTPDAHEVYDLLNAALVEATIPACVPGANGARPYEATFAYLEPQRAHLVAIGFCPPGDAPLAAIFGRDVGHLLGKQEPATVVMEKGNEERFEPGMTAAAELQWPYRDYCIGIEDVFMTTDDVPINLTRPAQ